MCKGGAFLSSIQTIILIYKLESDSGILLPIEKKNITNRIGICQLMTVHAGGAVIIVVMGSGFHYHMFAG